MPKGPRSQMSNLHGEIFDWSARTGILSANTMVICYRISYEAKLITTFG
mgnify:CR=1 FL=1